MAKLPLIILAASCATAVALQLVASPQNNASRTDCLYQPRNGDFEGTDDICVSGGTYSPSISSGGIYIGNDNDAWGGATEFHGHNHYVGCLEFVLDLEATVSVRYGREDTWTADCPVAILVNAIRNSVSSVTGGTMIDEITYNGEDYKVFTSAAYPPGTHFWMCEGMDNSICGIHIDYISVQGAVPPTPAPTTPAPTASPTPAPTPPPPLPPSDAMAMGDPHITTVRGKKFDLKWNGTITLLQLPRGAAKTDSLLLVEGLSKQYGAACELLYLDRINVTGSWALATGKGPYLYQATRHCTRADSICHKRYLVLGPGVKLVLSYARTDTGIHYLNLKVLGLQKARVAVGGLLGDEGHAWGDARSADCQSLLQMEGGQMEGGAGRGGSRLAAQLDSPEDD